MENSNKSKDQTHQNLNESENEIGKQYKVLFKRKKRRKACS